MRFLLIAVGRDRRGPTAELVDIYQKRCPWPLELIDISPRGQGEPERRRREEAQKILQALPANTAIIALDEHGKDLSSRNLALRIQEFQQDGCRTLAFIIGGADGLDPSIQKRADLCLAFGRATWPHRLVRAMLAEQLYRASTILTGHPYHRD